MGRLSRRYTNTLPSLPDSIDDKLVEHLKSTLEEALQDKYGNDTLAKLVSLDHLAERVKNRDIPKKSPCMVAEGRVALFMVLTELRLNNKIRVV